MVHKTNLDTNAITVEKTLVVASGNIAQKDVKVRTVVRTIASAVIEKTKKPTHACHVLAVRRKLNFAVIVQNQ